MLGKAPVEQEAGGSPSARLHLFAVATLVLVAACDRSLDPEPVCIDGVEYLAFQTDSYRRGITPHLKPDGTPYTCDSGEDIRP